MFVEDHDLPPMKKVLEDIHKTKTDLIEIFDKWIEDRETGVVRDEDEDESLGRWCKAIPTVQMMKHRKINILRSMGVHSNDGISGHPDVQYLPDICMSRLLHYLPLASAKTLFAAFDLPSQYQQEHVFISHFEKTMRLRTFIDAHRQRRCTGFPFCRDSVYCIRCYIRGLARCITCLSPTSEAVAMCSAPAISDSGTKCLCSDIVFCRRCKFRYVRSEDVVRKSDFSCPCTDFINEDGCIKCIRECDSCANVGCVRSEHFRINTWNNSDNADGFWQNCDQCNKQHCCARLLYPEENETWQFFACPEYEDQEGKPVDDMMVIELDDSSSEEEPEEPIEQKEPTKPRKRSTFLSKLRQCFGRK